MENINEQEQLEQEYLTQTPSIQWFPGHMAKTRRVMKESLKLVDIVVELRDARIPKSSANPVLRQIVRQKPRVVLLNKSDMADPAQTARWVDWYRAQGLLAVPIESKSGKGIPAFYSAVREALKENGIPFEHDRFVPHITLIRKISAKKPYQIHLPKAEMTVKRASLMKSETKNGKVVYREL